jgi:ComF family protein
LKAPAPLEADYFCSRCRTPFLNASPLDDAGRCGLCSHGFTPFDAAYAYGAYEGVLRELIHLFKYGRVRTLARPLADLLVAALPREERFDAIAAMPMHWLRRWQRGFNQTDLLARELSRRTAIPMTRAVRRARRTPPQAGLTSGGRRANVSGAFAVRKASSLQGKRILLLDDVLTTGATVAACAATLKRAGAERVTVLVLARVDRRVFVRGRNQATGGQSG